MKRVHFLHIGKTGGTAIKSALHLHRESTAYEIIPHPHQVSLKDVPEGEMIFFFLRDPVSRFVSGFYSRQRQGKPHHHFEWNELEQRLFLHFQTPNQLALALADPLSPDHSLALESMKRIRHFRHYRHWYVSLSYFQSRMPDVLHIGFQESLQEDFSRLKVLLQLPESCRLPDDDMAAHRNPKEQDRAIEEKGLRALKTWYSEDYAFLSLCRKLMSKHPQE